MNAFIIRGLRVLALAAFLLWSSHVQAQSIDIGAAKGEGKVVVYGTGVLQAVDELHKGFEKKYGIRVEFWRASSTGVIDRALTEWRAGRPGFDAVEASWDVMLLMKKEGLFTRFIPPSSESFPDRFKDKDALITPWRLLPISILYNTQLVKAADAPKNLDDLLSPKWKGRITIPDASLHTTTAKFFWNLEKFRGEKWRDFVKALAKQQPHLVESFAPVPNVIIRGETQVGIGFIKFVKQYKGPIDYVLMDKYLADPTYLGLGARAPRPHAGKLYMEYATSAEGQTAIARDGEFVLYPGVYPPIREAEKVTPNMVSMDNPSQEEAKKLSAEFRQIFLGK